MGASFSPEIRGPVPSVTLFSEDVAVSIGNGEVPWGERTERRRQENGKNTKKTFPCQKGWEDSCDLGSSQLSLFFQAIHDKFHMTVAAWMPTWTWSGSCNDASVVFRGQSSSPSSASV